MSRCKSPVTSKHERCSSTDAGIMRDSFNHGSSIEDASQHVVQHEDEMDGSVLNGSMDLGDDGDGRRAAIEHMQSKISRTRDLIKGEQTARDDNVNEYLKLASNADRGQVQRIKAVFEKKNQKSAQSIQQLQKKLESYNKKLKELESKALHGASHHHHRQPREVLRDMGQGLKHVGGNIRDGITGLSGSVMSKPREFAHLIRNKFGSADNINSLSRNGESDSLEDEKTHHGSATLPGGCGLGSGLKFTSEEGSECSSVTSESMPCGGTGGHGGGGHTTTSPPSSTTHPPSGGHTPSLEMVFSELKSRKHEADQFREKLDSLKDIIHKEVAYLNQALVEERFRCERLEEQVNDLTELHQNEVENLKTAISDMEEKVQYQSEERLRDIHDILESCQTKISKMEHQQAQHQQYLTLEGLDNSNARALVVKLINVVLTVLQVVLLLVATVAGIIMPFLRTRLRVLSTTMLVIALIVVAKQWPEISDMSANLSTRFRMMLSRT
ncbi:transmembrane and coiled-coil domains protein 2 isoform X2 [Cimex lectularius]|nr:transmembrane and coiled-coil domains protein 2 isoform X2 [Cimex lectularius]XP_014262328.1 transmembrane and coiled-coil domains protein 2 isoform X2 [Cimex lectularius]